MRLTCYASTAVLLPAIMRTLLSRQPHDTSYTSCCGSVCTHPTSCASGIVRRGTGASPFSAGARRGTGTPAGPPASACSRAGGAAAAAAGAATECRCPARAPRSPSKTCTTGFVIQAQCWPCTVSRSRYCQTWMRAQHLHQTQAGGAGDAEVPIREPAAGEVTPSGHAAAVCFLGSVLTQMCGVYAR